MEKVKYLILGAGPAGLAFAHQLRKLGEESFLILEKESEAGGLCRTRIVEHHPMDIGGAHLFETDNQEFLDFLFSFMPREEWSLFNRISKIHVHGSEIGYPFESHIWQFPANLQEEHLNSLSKAGINTGEPEPSTFSQWVRWKLGDKIADSYMIPYNEKIWSIDLDTLGTYWLHKLPSVSFEQTKKGFLQKRFVGKIPCHSAFLYPKKHGSGELWKKIANSMKNQIVFNKGVHNIDLDNMIVEQEFKAEKIVTTVPWTEFLGSSQFPPAIRDAITRLRYSSVETAYYPEDLDTDAHWIYVPDRSTPHHRIILRKNFCLNSRGYWTETNAKRIIMPRKKPQFSYINEHAYPIPTFDKPQAIRLILEWAKKKSIYGLGRWGTWEHLNMDDVVTDAINLSRSLKQG